MLVLATVTDPDELDALEDAERAMNEACEPLDRLAAQRRAGRALSAEARRAVLPSLDACACASYRLEVRLAALEGEAPPEPPAACQAALPAPASAADPGSPR